MDRRTFVFAAPALALLGCATANTPPVDTSGLRFSDAERGAIIDYYAKERARAPARDKPAQQAKAGDKLQSGARPAHLPNALKDRLPTLPDPYTRLLLGADVILLNRNTHDILDVVPQVAY